MISERTYYPSFPLNQFIDCIWMGKASQINLSSSHHAPLFTELIFNYGDQFQVEGENIKNDYSQYTHQIISGLKTSPFQTKVAGNYASVGLLLKPYCYGILIGAFGSSLMERISEIIYLNLFDTNTPNFKAVEQHLFSLFKNTQIDSDLIKFEKYTNSIILEKGGLSNFNTSISISQKSFIQKFKRYYSLTPSQYIKLKKVNTAVKLLQNKSSNKLGTIGLDAGFYDQSHFIKTFKKFCGSTPKDFRK